VRERFTSHRVAPRQEVLGAAAEIAAEIRRPVDDALWQIDAVFARRDSKTEESSLLL
jgi:hypothetical protein